MKESMHPRKTTPGGLKEQLHTIVDELRSSMHTSAPRPRLAVIGTGMSFASATGIHPAFK